MPSTSSIRDRLSISVEQHGPLAQRIVAGVLLAGLVAGAYLAGQHKSNAWWRSQIAQKSAAAAAVERECQSSCVSQDQRMIEAFLHDHAKPAAAAEEDLARAREEGRREAVARARTGAPAPRCTLAADCLRD